MSNKDKHKQIRQWMRSLAENRQFSILMASVRRFNKMEGSIFSGALAIQFFIAILPLLIVGLALIKINFEHTDIGYQLITQYNLQGRTAQIVMTTFATVEDNYRLATISSLLTLIIFSYGLVSIMQSIFARAWQADIHLGWRGILLGICWLVIYLLIEFIEDFVENPDWALPMFAVTIVCMFFLWLVTPKLFIAKPLSWKDSLPTAIMGSICLIIFRVAEWHVFPELLYTYSEPFGGFGVSFSLLIWIWIFAYSWIWVAAYGAVYFEYSHSQARGSSI